jgi:heterodisulfide reductase subunit C
MIDAKTHARAPTFFDVVVGITPGESNLDKCIQCGTCGGSCPSGADMDQTPRALFAMINAGMKDEVLKSNTPWYCVSCYYCMVRCPQDIHITDLMYSLKRLAIHEDLYQSDTRNKDASGFSETFIDFVENYGRSFELGLATRYHLTHHPLDMPKMAPMGWGMLRKGRMSLTPKRIKNLDSFKAILDKAKELEAEMYTELEA